VILVVPEDPSRITANLRAPLVIHTVTRTGVQLVLEGDQYPVRAPLLPAPVPGGKGGGRCSC
jgi:flagellar assembly factor FliW